MNSSSVGEYAPVAAKMVEMQEVEVRPQYVNQAAAVVESCVRLPPAAQRARREAAMEGAATEPVYIRSAPPPTAARATCRMEQREGQTRKKESLLMTAAT